MSLHPGLIFIIFFWAWTLWQETWISQPNLLTAAEVVCIQRPRITYFSSVCCCCCCWNKCDNILQCCLFCSTNHHITQNMLNEWAQSSPDPSNGTLKVTCKILIKKDKVVKIRMEIRKLSPSFLCKSSKILPLINVDAYVAVGNYIINSLMSACCWRPQIPPSSHSN